MVSALGENGRRYSNDALVADADEDSMHIKVLAIAALMHIFQSLFTDERVLDAVLPIAQVGSTPAYTFAQQRRINNESDCSEKESYFKGVASYGDKMLQQFLFGSRKKWRIITEQNEDLVQQFMNPAFTVANKKKMKQMVKDGDEDVPAMSGTVSMKQLLECDFLAGFGLQECRSALPKLLDGLTDVQRKIMYEAPRSGKRNIRMNVNRAGTDFASRTKCHHAPQSMQEALLLLASNKPRRCCISFIRGISSVESRHAPGRESMPSPRYADVDVMPELLTLLFPAQHYEAQQLLQM
jgi:hypothetical protein